MSGTGGDVSQGNAGGEGGITPESTSQRSSNTIILTSVGVFAVLIAVGIAMFVLLRRRSSSTLAPLPATTPAGPVARRKRNRHATVMMNVDAGVVCFDARGQEADGDVAAVADANEAMEL